MKKNIKISSICSLFALLLIACHKSDTVTSPASINIINAMADANPIIPSLGGTVQYYNTAQQIPYGFAQLYTQSSGKSSISISQTSDTSMSVFRGTFELAPGNIYSLFLIGDTTSPDTLFIRDNIPQYGDSAVGIRFVNLLQGKSSVSINLQNNPISQTEFDNLGYKQITPFKKYPVTIDIPGSYTFEIHDLASGELLSTFSWYYMLYKNNTIFISGSIDPSGIPLVISQMNNY